jgi:hypothetical protein
MLGSAAPPLSSPSGMCVQSVSAGETVPSLQVETGNTCSWTMTIWFRLNNEEAPQIAHFLVNEDQELVSCAHSSPDSTRVAGYRPVETITTTDVAPVVRALLPVTGASGAGDGPRKPDSEAADARLTPANTGADTSHGPPPSQHARMAVTHRPYVSGTCQTTLTSSSPATSLSCVR